MTAGNPTMERLEDQIAWYDRKSIESQQWFKRLKIAAIVAAAMIPFAAAYGKLAFFTGALGVFIVVFEGLQGLNQYQQNWITYRSTCEELKHEKYLWLAKAGPYVNTDNADTLLAERVESLISREHAKWVSTREQAEKQLKKAQG
ncbi:MAG: DUF4231 domain-containing protein [candidate division NC10 bacterium]|nr:DUF4231 domain-containing protein [candidate division NC10 bacterium]